MKKYNKKTYAVLIITTLLIGSLPLTGGMTQKNEKTITYNNGDEIDQDYSGNTGISLYAGPFAQSFKPTKSILTRVKIPVTGDIDVLVSIRTSQSGQILTSVVVHAPEETGVYVECDFDDIRVTPESTYFIVVESVGTLGFGWGKPYIGTYLRGQGYEKRFLVGWVAVGDFYFQTFGTSANNNVPPNPPSPPFGEANCVKSKTYEFTSQTTDANNDPIYFLFDWDDGTTTDWIGPRQSGSEIVASHSWDQAGTYEIKVKARDDSYAESGWSEPLTINVLNSARPNKPHLSVGAGTPIWPNKGEENTEYSYVVSATDPDGDQLLYLFEWGDGTDSGWLGPFSSGKEITASHSWQGKNEYDIRVKAKDTTGAESVWSDSETVVINVILGAVYGTLTDYDGNPIADHPVSMSLYHPYSAGIKDPSTSMRTDENGNYFFEGIPFDKKYVSGLRKGQPLEFEVSSRRDTWGANYEYGWQTFTMPYNGKYVLHRNVCLNHETHISKSKDIFHSQSLLYRVITHLLNLF
jgi:hypothetical protein